MRRSVEGNVIIGLVVVFVVLIANTILSNQAANTLARDGELVAHSHETQTAIEDALSTVLQAESSARGYVITGDESHLEPYRQAIGAIDRKLERLGQLIAGNPGQQQRFVLLRGGARAMFDHLGEIIDLRQRDGFPAAQASVLSNHGKREMDKIRRIVGEMYKEETALLMSRDVKSRESHGNARLTLLISTFTSLALVILLGWVLMLGLSERRRNEAAIGEQREWLQITLSSIGDAVIATNAHGSIRFLNPVAEALTGWTQAEVEGKHLSEVFKIVNEYTHQMALTAHARAKDRARVLAAGFQMHIAKPVSAAELVIGVGSLAWNLGRNV
jgi:CHASE3 domain sensor protein/CheY-like chemotaxis protein